MSKEIAGLVECHNTLRDSQLGHAGKTAVRKFSICCNVFIEVFVTQIHFSISVFFFLFPPGHAGFSYLKVIEL